MKHWKNLKYLLRHKWFVLVAGVRLRVPLWRLLIHDWSKFTTAEWTAYADNFFAGYPQNAKPYQVGRAFKRAWRHHVACNPHHWEYWTEKFSHSEWVEEMPEHFAREMVADWAGAGRAISGKWEVFEWYEKNKARMLLNTSTQELTESLIALHFPKS